LDKQLPIIETKNTIKTMKVLWFSLSPGLSDGYLNNNYKGIGWVKSLEKNVQDKVDLSIAFYHDTDIAPFKLGATNYFPVKRYKYGKLSKAKRRLFNGIEAGSDIDLFLKIVNEVKPDLIHIHGTEGPFGLVQKYTSIPTVVSIQGTITVYRHKFFSAISYFNTLKYSRVKNFFLSRSFINVYHQFTKMADREQQIYRRTKHFIGRTAWDRRVTAVLAPSAKYHHNDEILRDSFYKHRWDNKLSGRLMLFTTNGPNLYKGIETLMECAGLLDLNNVDFEWRVAGLKSSDEIVNIAARSIGKPISKGIKFLGSVDEESLIKELLQSHIYIATSHIENSPNSLCEAQILGMPCIATHAGGTNSLVEDDKDGVLIQDGDPYSMAGAVMELKNNYDKAIMLGENSRKRALARHNPEKITCDLLEIYKTILQGN
jgi:glycosyltransferase involved in cell wall biosynthesis